MPSGQELYPLTISPVAQMNVFKLHGTHLLLIIGGDGEGGEREGGERRERWREERGNRGEGRREGREGRGEEERKFSVRPQK